MSQYNESGTSRCSKWPKNWIVAMYKEEEAAEKDDRRSQLVRFSRKYWHVASGRVVLIG